MPSHWCHPLGWIAHLVPNRLIVVAADERDVLLRRGSVCQRQTVRLKFKTRWNIFGMGRQQMQWVEADNGMAAVVADKYTCVIQEKPRSPEEYRAWIELWQTSG